VALSAQLLLLHAACAQVQMLWLLHLSAAARMQISPAWPVTLHLQVDRPLPLLLLLLCCLRY
jgi:hypothetical protein